MLTKAGGKKRERRTESPTGSPEKRRWVAREGGEKERSRGRKGGVKGD